MKRDWKVGDWFAFGLPIDGIHKLKSLRRISYIYEIDPFELLASTDMYYTYIYETPRISPCVQAFKYQLSTITPITEEDVESSLIMWALTDEQ